MPTYITEHVYIGTGAQTNFIFNKGYLSRSHVLVKVSTDSGANYVLKADPADYEWIDSQTIRFAVAPVADAVIWLDRETPRTIDINYDNGTVFTDTNQNYGYRQAIYILQEILDELERRPSLDVQQNDIEQTLAQVIGNIALDADSLDKTSFNLKATLGRNASNVLTVALSKESEATAAIANTETATVVSDVEIAGSALVKTSRTIVALNPSEEAEADVAETIDCTEV